MIVVTGNLYDRDGPRVTLVIDDAGLASFTDDAGNDMSDVLPAPTETVRAFVPGPEFDARVDRPANAFAVALSLIVPYTLEVDGDAPAECLAWARSRPARSPKRHRIKPARDSNADTRGALHARPFDPGE